jgi:GTP pyrophosphokinase
MVTVRFSAEHSLNEYVYLGPGSTKSTEPIQLPGVVPGITPPPLSEVYVQPFAWADSSSDLPSQEEKKLPAETVFEPPGNTILIGGPGAGKSSLLRTAVRTTIQTWMNGQPVRSVPVRVQAAQLVAARPLPEAIADSVSGDLNAFASMQSWPPAMFTKQPFAGAQWLVLVDGLDELMSAEHRHRVLSKLASIYDQEAHLFRFVVTTRPLPEDEPAVPPAWKPRCFRLLPFTTEQFAAVAAKWFGRLGQLDPAADVQQFTAQIRDADLTEISRNPLMATMLCQLFVANPSTALPPSRSRIFDEFEELLNQRQYGSAPGGIRHQLVEMLAPFGRTAEDAGEQLLARAPSLIGRLAWHRMRGNITPATDLIDSWLSGLKPDHVPVAAWRGVLRDMLRRSGVLQERADEFIFFHQTIAEHLAAKYVAADTSRSNAAFDELFRQASWKDTESSSLWRQSYARFLVAEWAGRPDLPGALTRVLDRDGPGGAQFVAFLRLDGIELPHELHDRSLKRLQGFAVDPKLSEPVRRASASTVLASDEAAGTFLLASTIRTPSLNTSYRDWAIETLAGVRDPLLREPAARSRPGNLRQAMHSLAQHNDAHGRELIAQVADSPQWPESRREWAAQALRAVGDLRGATAPSPARRKPLPVGGRFALLRSRPRTLDRSRARASDLVLEPLIKTIQATHHKADVRTVKRAYGVSADWHRDQKRKSGDPYITHPLAVATILAELGMNTEAACAALLHDILEETPYTLAELRSDFGEDIAAMVDGVTKLDKVRYGESAEAETVRKMVVATSRDIRVLIIELACRLHDMRTLRYLPRDEQERKSREVLEIFAPLTDRLGMNTVKGELEDLAFAALYPKRYDEIARLVAQRADKRDVFLQKIISDLSGGLREAKIKGTVTDRPSNYYSIYQKMIARSVEFDNIHDLVGIRVLVNSVRDCYAALGTIHARWNPVPGRIEDFIAMPKFGTYQSLHTTVISAGGKRVELQICTLDMHKRAEFGVTAHWKYKDDIAHSAGKNTTGSKAAKNEIAEMTWLRQLVDWQRETEDPAEFLDSLRYDLGGTQVFVFTPRGEVIALPHRATPVDFAYAIHTDVGHRTIGARVNGRLVALESTLDNGDTVEIFTSKSTAGPNRDWLNFVKSARARNKIRQWFSKERHEAAVEAGKDQIALVMRKQGLPLQRLASPETLHEIAGELLCPDLSGLYAAVSEGRVSAQVVVGKLVQKSGGLARAHEELAGVPLLARVTRIPRLRSDSGVEVEGAAGVRVRLSKCCAPVPGDEIGGFTTHGHGVAVHRVDCANFVHLTETETQRERVVKVHWAPTGESVFLVAIQVEALDRARLVADVTTELSDHHVKILSSSVTTTREQTVISRFTFEMGDPKHLGDVLRAVRSIDGVYDVYRMTN